MQDEEGQIVEAHSVSAGLDYPGTGPQHAFLRDSGRARYVAVTDADALAAFREVARLEGIIPALETAHALAWVAGQRARASWTSCACPGAGDKDLAEVLALSGSWAIALTSEPAAGRASAPAPSGASAASGIERIARPSPATASARR